MASSSADVVSDDPLTREMGSLVLGGNKEEWENSKETRAQIQATNEECIDILERERVAIQSRRETFYQSQVTTVDPLEPMIINKIFHPSSSTATIKQSDIIALYLSDLSSAVKTPRVQVLGTSLVHPTLRLKDRIYLKIPSHYDDNLEVEYAIGFYMINELRSLIPNFMLTYGIFACGETDSDAKGICDPRAPTAQYLAVEKINNAVSSFDFVKTASMEDMLLLYLQVYLALLVAKEHCAFAHYDLHSDNVLIQRLKEPRKQRYTVQGINYDLVLNFVAIIIDFGFSMASKVVEGKKLIIASSNTFGITRTYPEPNIGADMYRFFMTTQMAYPGYKRFQWMYNTFQDSDVVYDLGKAFEEQKERYYYYPRSLNSAQLEIIISGLVNRCLGYSGGKVSPPDTFEYVAPIASTLDFYERYNILTRQENDVSHVLVVANSAITQIKALRTEIGYEKDNVRRYYMSRKYVTLCRLYIFYYEHFRDVLEGKGIYEGFYRGLRYLVERVETEDKSEKMMSRKKAVSEAKARFFISDKAADFTSYQKAKLAFDRTSEITFD